MSDTNKKSWFNELQTQITTLTEQFDLDPIQSEQFRESVLGMCKAEFMKGNKSGIAWAFKKAAEKNAQAA